MTEAHSTLVVKLTALLRPWHVTLINATGHELMYRSLLHGSHL